VYSRTQRENSICQGSPFHASALEETRRLYIGAAAVAGLGTGRSDGGVTGGFTEISTLAH
jgi:hypothetical protein